MRIRWCRTGLVMLTSIFLILNLVLFLALLVQNDPDYIASHLPPIPPDTTPPRITLYGPEQLNVAVDSVFEDPGVKTFDVRSDVDLEVNSDVDTSMVGQYTITYIATDKSGNFSTAERIVNVIKPSGIIYLTFDDGPGDHTARLLDILKQYGVKATFFVTGNGDDALIQREYEEGHAIGLHTLSHNYAYIYSSVDNFFADLIAVQDRVRNITGHTSYLMRFPGGSSNTVSTRYDGHSRIMSTLVDEVESRGFTYFDWNITSGDAGETTDTNVVYDRVINGLVYDGDSVVLQHDIKGFSVDAVERIIQFGLEHNFIFDKLSENSFTAHHGVNN